MDGQQDVPQVKSSPYQSPMYNFGSSIILLTNPENELYKLELTLRALKVDKDGNVGEAGEALLNDEGVNSVIGMVQTIVNQVCIMSNLEDRHIPMLIDFLGDTLAKDLMLNRKKYCIKNPAARDKIFFTCLTSAFITMRRAFEGDDKKFWKGSVQEIRTSNEGAARRGLLSGLLNWGKK